MAAIESTRGPTRAWAWSPTTPTPSWTSDSCSGNTDPSGEDGRGGGGGGGVMTQTDYCFVSGSCVTVAMSCCCMYTSTCMHVVCCYKSDLLAVEL